MQNTPLTEKDITFLCDVLWTGYAGSPLLDLTAEEASSEIAPFLDERSSAAIAGSNGGRPPGLVDSLLALRPRAGADLLDHLLTLRDDTVREKFYGPLEGAKRRAYSDIVARLRHADVGEERTPAPASSGWTGRRSVAEQVAIIRALVPMAAIELQRLAELVEDQRFNDPLTADAVQRLHELHQQLGDLLEAVKRRRPFAAALAAVDANRAVLMQLMQEGAKVSITAPAMTLGVVHLLALLTGCTIDTQLVGSVYASMLGHDVLARLALRRGSARA